VSKPSATASSFAAAAAVLGIVGAAATQPAGEGAYVAAGQLQAKVAGAPNGLATFAVPTGTGATVLMVRRTMDGEVELHTRMNDEFVGHAGHATIRVGGRVDGNRQTEPGEWRGGKMTGGRTYELSPGDVLWIPAGAPHQVLVPKGGAFDYLAFKFEAKAP